MKTRSLLTLAFCASIASSACGNRARNAADVAPPPLPAPTRPTDVLVSAHFGQPNATVESLGQIMGQSIPAPLLLALGLGVDSTIISASDLTQPMDMFLIGTAEHPELVFVFTPTPAAQFRSTLTNRFRLVRAENLGERLDPQNAAPNAPPPRGTRCAIVGVPGPNPQRLVCANRLSGLERAGRFAAYESQRLAAEHRDLAIDVDGATVREALTPLLTRAIDENSQALAASAADERRRHDRAPDLGDPEAALTGLTGMARSAVAELRDIRHLTVRGTLSTDGLALESDLAMDNAGVGALASDARSRVRTEVTHPLASQLAPDSIGALSSRTRGTDRHAFVDTIVQNAIGVLGTRVSDATAARADVNALFAQLGDETAVGVAREPEGGMEITALFAQQDDGTAARTALANLARAPWLRALRFGDASVDTTFARGVLTLRTRAPRTRPPAARPASAAQAGAPEATTPALPQSLSITVSGNALAMVIGAHTDTTLAALPARANGQAPAVLNQTHGAFVGGVDLSLLGAGNEPNAHPIVHADYNADEAGGDVVGHGRVSIPALVLRGALRAALPSGLR